MKYIKVKNWDTMQHYKDRNPPWIKLYNTLLDDFDFCLLPDVSKCHLIAIWLLASRTGNKIPASAKWISGKISATEEVDIDLLIESGFLVDFSMENNDLDIEKQDASKSLHNAEQNDCLEERRGETEKSREYCRSDESSQASVDSFKTKDGDWACPGDFRSECVRLYGEQNVKREFEKAAFWLLSNPAKQKTRRGMTKFLGAWLARCQEKDPAFKAPVEYVPAKAPEKQEITAEDQERFDRQREAFRKMRGSNV